MGNLLASHVKHLEPREYFFKSPYAHNWNACERLALAALLDRCGWTQGSSSHAKEPSGQSAAKALIYARDIATIQALWNDAHSRLAAMYAQCQPLMLPFLDMLFASASVSPGVFSADRFPYAPSDLLLCRLGTIFKSSSSGTDPAFLAEAYSQDQILALVLAQYRAFEGKLSAELGQQNAASSEGEPKMRLRELLAGTREENTEPCRRASRSFFYEHLLHMDDAGVLVPAFRQRGVRLGSSLLNAFFIWYLCHSLRFEGLAGGSALTQQQQTSSQSSVWHLVYQLQTQGQNWHAFADAITRAGSSSLLFIVKDTQGHIFGAHALSENGWRISPRFAGHASTRLFTLFPRLNMYSTSGHNTHYHYFNDGAISLPNGLGFGGQLGYFGLFIASDLTQGSAEPSCSTFGPNFQCLASRSRFQIEDMEVWSLDSQLYDRNTINQALPTSSNKGSMATRAEFLNMLNLAREPIRSREGYANDVAE